MPHRGRICFGQMRPCFSLRSGGTAFALSGSKSEAMKQTPTHTARGGRRTEPAGVTTLTQITPDDILAEQGPIAPTGENDPVSEEKVEQDVAETNPSPESMDSRG